MCSVHEFLDEKEDFLHFYRYVSQSVFLSYKTWAEIELARVSVALLRSQIQPKVAVATITDRYERAALLFVRFLTALLTIS